MARRTIVILTAIAFILATGSVAWHFIRPKPVITYERAEAIQLGMTRAEVIALLGGPPGDYAGGHSVTYVRGCVGEDASGFYDGTNWWGRQGMIQVQFSPDGLVESVGYYQAHSASRVGVWDTVRSMLPSGRHRCQHEWVPGCW
jgi:hypothetical protein